MSAENALAKLEAQVLKSAGVGGWLKSVDTLRVLLARESPDIKRVVLAMILPRVEAQAKAAVLDAFGIGADDAMRIVREARVGTVAKIGKPSKQALALVKGLDKRGRQAMAVATKLARAGADTSSVLAPLFAHADKVRRSVSDGVNMAGNEGSTAVADAAKLSTVWVAETNACVHCLAYSGRVAKPGKTFPGGLTYGKKSYWPDRIKHPPLHPRCLPFDTLVTPGSRVSGASARIYDGEMVRIKTLSERELTGTPNHPVLTRRGWVSLGLLQPGDEVVARLGGERVIRRDDDDEQMPAILGELAHATLGALKMAAREVPVSAVDFHGDGSGSEVSVIATDSLLQDMLDAPLCEHHREELFDVATRRGLLLSRESGAHEPLVSKADTTGSSMGGIEPREALLGGGAGHTESLGGLATTTLDASFGEAPSYDIPANANPVGDALLALPRFVGRDGGGAVNSDATGGHRAPLATVAGSPTRHGVALEQGEDAGLSDAEAIADVLRALPSEVTLDSIISVNRYAFHGMVYNLETVKGWYIANGIVTHNCRCTIEPLNDKSYAEALRREADRSVLRGFSLESESMGTRVDAAQRLLDKGVNAPASVIKFAERGVKNGKFSTRGRPAK